jgi:acyl-CoA synthetase (AMP-forming)/AMP-acid ligase II
VGIPDSFYGQKAVLLTTNKLENDHKIQLNEYLKDHIASEDCPKSIIYRPSFELLPNGKIDALKTLALYVETIK